jgi:hypothetical protein
MAYADPAPAFYGYQDQIWELMRGGECLGGVEDAIEETDVAGHQKAALWLLAFSLSDPDAVYDGQAPDPSATPAPWRRHLSLVPELG